MRGAACCGQIYCRCQSATTASACSLWCTFARAVCSVIFELNPKVSTGRCLFLFRFRLLLFLQLLFALSVSFLRWQPRTANNSSSSGGGGGGNDGSPLRSLHSAIFSLLHRATHAHQTWRLGLATATAAAMAKAKAKAMAAAAAEAEYTATLSLANAFVNCSQSERKRQKQKTKRPRKAEKARKGKENETRMKAAKDQH